MTAIESLTALRNAVSPVTSFLHHLPLVGVAALVVALAAGAVARGLGVPLLVWHERRWPRFLAAFSLTLLAGHVGFVGFLLDRHPAGLTRYVLTILGVVAAATVVTLALQRSRSFDMRGLAFPLGALLGGATVVGLVLAANTTAIRPFQEVVNVAVTALGPRVVAPPQVALDGVAAAIVLLVALGFAAGSFDRSARFVTPVAAVALALALLTAIYGFVAYHFSDAAPVAALAIVVTLLLLRRGAQDPSASSYDELIPTNPAKPGKSPGPLLSVRDAIKNRTDPTQPLAVICTSGGASRAAAWTAAVLARLERTIPGFSRRVVLITGASGGMVGAAYHVARLNRPEDGTAPAPDERAVVAALGKDSLSRVVHRLVYRDLPSAILVKKGKDRGRALEEAWSSSLGGALDRTFDELKKGESQGWLPSLVFSPMLVEDGRRLLVSNLDLGDLATNEWTTVAGTRSTSQSEVEVGKVFANAGTLRLATAARMSASFPFVSPADPLPTTPRRRVVDAGYYDDYGVNLAGIWVDWFATELRAAASKIVLIQIRDTPTEEEHAHVELPSGESSPFARGVEFLTTPPEAVLAARESVMAYRNDELVEILQRKHSDFVSTVAFEGPEGVGMSWVLTHDEQKALLAELDGGRVAGRTTALARWWAAGTSERGQVPGLAAVLQIWNSGPQGRLVVFDQSRHDAAMKEAFAARGKGAFSDMHWAARGQTLLVAGGRDWPAVTAEFLAKHWVYAVEDASQRIQGFVWTEARPDVADVAYLAEKGAAEARREELLMPWALGLLMQYLLESGTVKELTAKPDTSAGNRVPFYIHQLMGPAANANAQHRCTLATLRDWKRLKRYVPPKKT